MSTSPVVQLDPTSLDDQGLSVATSPASATVLRQGAAYDPVSFAAAAPVWFHPMYGADWLMLSARTWTAATPIGGTPGFFSAYTESTAPSWRAVSPFTGSSHMVAGQGLTLPMNTVATAVVLRAAASRPPNILWVLSSATVNTVATAVLQRFNLNLNGSVTLYSEEVLPTPGDVVFDKGLQYATPNLVVYGTDASNQVYKMTKPWGQVGVNSTRTVSVPKRGSSALIGDPQGWQYFTGTGYSADPTTLAPLPGLSTHGPMSFGGWRNQTFLTTVELSGTTYTGQVWVARSGLSFSALGGLSVPLGSSSDGSYLGGGIQLLPQLAPNPAATALAAPGVLSGIPYVTWTRTLSGSDHSLDTVWNILPVTA